MRVAHANLPKGNKGEFVKYVHLFHIISNLTRTKNEGSIIRYNLLILID
jgi:hypothetical protein